MSRGPELAAAVAARTSLILEALEPLRDDELSAQSRLDGWSRLTVVCHLRYGAVALRRMTDDTLAGRPTAYYPDGRERRRPGTLVPAPGETPRDVVVGLRTAAAALDERWASLAPGEWATEIIEPADNADLGSVTLGRLAMSRLLEVDVHGTDMEIGFPDWSRTLVEVALPTRLAWLATRRTNHRPFDRSLQGSWQLVASDGPTWLVSTDGDRVRSVASAPGADRPTAVIEGSSRDLLALLLGRPPVRPLVLSGDREFARSFSRAFPGP